MRSLWTSIWLRPARGIVVLAPCLVAWLIPEVWAQIPDVTVTQSPEAEVPPGTILTMFRHSDETKYWVSGQMNFIFQFHPSFYALYSGPHSLQKVVLKELLQWSLTTGQEACSALGYSPLPKELAEQQLKIVENWK